MVPHSREAEVWRSFVLRFVEAFEEGGKINVGSQEDTLPLVEDHHQKNLPRLVICAPHPDDELLTGAFALRLRLQKSASVLALYLTLGRDPSRRDLRKQELAAACRVAGFSWRLVVDPHAFPMLRPELEHEAEWQRMVAELEDNFARDAPAVVLAPHALDGHPAHRAAGKLVVGALKNYTRNRRCRVMLLETEYWQPMTGPNLLLGVTPEELALLLAALAGYRGEMARQPYHLRQPGRMMDNVRRGSELVCGFGQGGADFPFGELYRLSRVVNGRLFRASGKKVLLPGERIDLEALSALFGKKRAQ
jgi:N-acetylglucosamine malate deacetylase 1